MRIQNQVSLYKKLTEETANLVGIEALPLSLSYNTEDELKVLDIPQMEDNNIIINDFADSWSPTENELNLKQKIVFYNPSIIYGKDKITMPENTVGLAVHIHSKTSNFQKTIAFGEIPNIEKKCEIEFAYSFPSSSLRGNIQFDFFVFLKEVKNVSQIQASKVGMILCEDDLLSFNLIVDGIGSEFPMSEFYDKKGPLWKLEKNWVEPEYDIFSSANVNLSLNTAHPLFEQLKTGKTKVSRAMMDDIMVQAMCMIIQQVIFIDEVDVIDDEIIPNSILSAVNYWISTFELDISSLFSVSNSMKNYWSKNVLEEGIND